MPFTKVGDDDYVSTSGRHFSGAQVKLYYASAGTFDKNPEDDDLAKKVEVTATHKALKKELLKRATRLPRGVVTPTRPRLTMPADDEMPSGSIPK